MMEQNVVEKDQFVKDLINALAVYKAKEAGVFGQVKLEAEEIGVIGAATTDIQDTSIKYINAEISKENAIAETKSALATTVSIFIKTMVDKAIDPIAEVIKTKIPALAKVIDVTKEWIKTYITVEKIKETGRRVSNWVREKLKI